MPRIMPRPGPWVQLKISEWEYDALRAKARRLYRDETISVIEIGVMVGVSDRTIFRWAVQEKWPMRFAGVNEKHNAYRSTRRLSDQTGRDHAA